MTTLVVVLGDQLSDDLASLAASDPADSVVLMMEVAEEATYVKHHKKKIALILSAMRHFAARLEAMGWRIDYVRLDARGNSGSFSGEVARAAKRHKAKRIRVVEPGEWRVEQAMLGWEKATGVPVEILDDERFLCSRAGFAAWAEGRKSLTMEYFYREMRRRTGWLMEGKEPVGGQWNFDHDNRKTPPRGLNYPAPHAVTPDETTREVLALVEARFADHFGDLEPFDLPVTREEALKALDHFVHAALPGFGDYQDAMVAGQPTLYHSLLSPLINCGLLSPREVCVAVIDAYDRGEAPINAVEGFVRQILGWREYVRGLYWLDMPEYATRNALRAHRPLPEFYWTGETDLRCLSTAVSETRAGAYAHHIQRLMVLGNFALLAGIDPAEVEAWFLVVYADAYQWVELPNVIGMSQHADGGRLGSKPYAASGAYINRMSDYCGGCRYDVKARTGKDACPFNALYWDFLARHEQRFRANMRMRNMYATWDRFSDEQKRAIRAQAKGFLDTLEPAKPGWARD